jgi:tripartite-type tricarboxylate transporter receptor subunit TctC
MQISRRVAAVVLAAVALLLGTAMAGAQPYPAKPVRFVVPFPAGGSADTLARTIGLHLGERLGQQFVVENRPGAGGNLGTELVAKSPPDGYTLLMTPSSIAIAPALYTRLAYDPVKDFAPVTLVGNIPMVVVVNPQFPAKTLGELIALAKAKAGEINYASAGNGTTNHLAVELFKATTGIDMVHIPYKGNPLAVLDVISGQVPVFFDFVLTGLPHVRERRVRALATTGAKRSAVLPDVPTVIEAGVPGYEAGTWFGVYAPAGTPRDIVAKLDTEIQAVLALPQVKERFDGLGVELSAARPEALEALTKSDLAKWGRSSSRPGSSSTEGRRRTRDFC